MNLLASDFLSVFARSVVLFVAALGLASCGSGAVSGPPVVITPGPISVTPAEATLYSDLPTTFVVSGGNGSYIVTSSNQSVVPNIPVLSGNSFTLVPSQVAVDTPLSLTVRDTGSAAPVMAALTVRPRTIENIVTVTPSASQSPACGTAVCSGGDAEVRISMRQNGIALRGRTVRFEVVSGDVRFITSAAGLPEQLSLSQTVLSDDAGVAAARIRVLADASAQTAMILVTDLSSGFSQRASLAIAPGSNAPLNAQPNTIVFKGVAPSTCASGINADVIVFGGRPPYSISQPGSFAVSPSVVTSNPGRFTVAAIGQCSAGSQIAVVDANGATVSVTASNSLSDVVATPTPTPTTPMAASPSSVTLDSCNAVATVTLSGGSRSYFGSSGNTAILVDVTGNLGSIRRRAASGMSTAPSAIVTVTFSDGQSTRPVSVDATTSGPC